MLDTHTSVEVQCNSASIFRRVPIHNSTEIKLLMIFKEADDNGENL